MSLKGTWILLSYQDSIKKGLTPQDICHLLNGPYRLFYDPSIEYSFLFPEDSSYYVFIDTKKTYPLNVDSKPNNDFEYTSQIGYTIKLDLKNSSGQFIEKKITNFYDTHLGKWKDSIIEPQNIGKFYLTTLKNDTLINLEFADDTIKTILVKSEDYNILINQKFIAGTYSLKDDDSNKQIIFTDSGLVSGLGLLDDSFAKANRYSVGMNCLPVNKDYLSFYRIEDKSLFPILFWSTKGDTMILSESSNNLNREFKLIKNKNAL
ncbi:MAG TPA: hypothetical protein VJ954_08775 [Ignavibacteriaceae bacterium]|nr:hypothetical protein [Ignavibacteriaceae bacterium]